MRRTLLVALCLTSVCIAHDVTSAAALVVHEWGTFTSYQDANGATIAGINVDDEPVPWFVHRLGGVPATGPGNLPARWSQGAPGCHPEVTMRLETPVLYFYPPSDWPAAAFDVQATFAGGWLTEYFPAATADRGDFPKTLDARARGSLLWKQVRLDPDAKTLLHDTTYRVWLAPRKVNATVVSNLETKEAEKYLFYRGVGHLDAPLTFKERNGAIDIALREGVAQLTTLPRVWLVEVLPDGRVRYQALQAGGRSISVAAFAPAAAGMKSSLEGLRHELADALTGQGLYADEAAAMLETWKLSYFESHGLRAFFLLPRGWTDAHLPLSISTPADVTRVMVGRVELVSAHQRAMLAKLQALPEASIPAVPLYVQDRSVIVDGLATKGPLSRLYRKSGRDVPKSLQAYESLGRFRDALLAHEWKRAADGNQRARLRRVLDSYSACVWNLTPEPLTTGR
jgi:hypothetical protein